MQAKVFPAKIISKKTIAEGTIEVSLGLLGAALDFKAGQHVDIHLPDLLKEDSRSGWRTMSISSSPNEKKNLRVACRISESGFKQTLLRAPIGTMVEIDGPSGVFTLPEDSSEPLVFVAGGIGITPFLSMIRYATEEKLPHHITLLYVNRSRESAPYLSELEALQKKNKNFILRSKFGLLDKDFLLNTVPQFAGAIWYIAGPAVMVVEAKKILLDAGISDTSIRTEEFSGYGKEMAISGIEELKYLAMLHTLNHVALVSMTDTSGAITYVNDKFVEIAKYNREELIGQNHRILKSGYHTASFYDELWKTISGRKVWRGEIKNRAKDGSFYWVDSSISPVFSDSNEIVAYVSVRFPVTERKLTEENLKKSENRFRNLTESISDAVVSTNEQGKIIFWNQAAETMFGYRNNEVLGRPLTLIMSRQYQEAYRNDMARILAGDEPRSYTIGKTIEIVGLKKAGQEFPMELSLAMSKNHETIFIAVIRDITERKLTDDALQKQTAELQNAQKALVNVLEDVKEKDLQLEEEKGKLQATLESIGDGAFSIDASGRIVFFNKVAEEISGYKTVEVIGKPYRSALRFILEKDDCENYKFIEEVFAKGIISRIGNHTALLTKDGRRVPVEDSAAPLKDADGKVVGAVVIFRDVTKARELDKTKTNFISIASHQLRTPLSALRWIAELFLGGDLGTLTNDQKSFLGDMYKSTRRLLDLVNTLLASSRVEDGRVDIKPVPTDIVALTREGIAGLHALIKAKNLHLTVAAQPLPKINLEPEMFSQVVLNLISNAINYTPDDGRITVQFELKQDLVICSVADTGIGIPKKDQQRIFEKFFRADNAVATVPDGSGLGLSLAKSIIATWGGDMRFESEEGKGTTFYFTVPLVGMQPRSGEVKINA